MRIGNLNKSVAIQVRETSTGADSRGQDTAHFVTVDTVWASIRPLSGREAAIARQIDETASHTIEVRYNDNVTPRARFKFGARYFNIGSVVNVEERGRFMQCSCTEEV